VSVGTATFETVLENYSPVLSLKPNSDLRNTSPGLVTFFCTAVANGNTSVFLSWLNAIYTSPFSPVGRKTPNNPVIMGKKLKILATSSGTITFCFSFSGREERRGVQFPRKPMLRSPGPGFKSSCQNWHEFSDPHF